MKSIYVLLGLAVCFFILFESCNDVCSCKKVPCPGYSNLNFDTWFPYDSGSTIIYTDSTGLHSDTLSIAQVYTAAPYDANKGCMNGGDVGCHSSKYINGNWFSVNYASNSNWDETVAQTKYSINVLDFNAEASALTPTGFDSVNLPAEFYPQISLNGKTYQNVQVIRRDASNYTGNVYKIFIQKNTGLLGYLYYPSLWLMLKK